VNERPPVYFFKFYYLILLTTHNNQISDIHRQSAQGQARHSTALTVDLQKHTPYLLLCLHRLWLDNIPYSYMTQLYFIIIIYFYTFYI